ncbi:MAG: hypothetical protein ACJA02_001258, partial [Myxococcota bacterium]
MTEQEIQTLLKNNGLDELFTSKSITSISGLGSKTTPKNAQPIVEALFANKNHFINLIENGFSAANISSILHGSGAKSGEAITALGQQTFALLDLIGNGFSSANISSILHGSGAKAG